MDFWCVLRGTSVDIRDVFDGAKGVQSLGHLACFRRGFCERKEFSIYIGIKYLLNFQPTIASEMTLTTKDRGSEVRLVGAKVTWVASDSLASDN